MRKETHMKIKANLMRSPDSLRPSQCEVAKVVELPSLDFSEFLAEPLARSDIIAENQELMYRWNEVDYCLLVLDKDGRDGVLVNTAGYISNNYAAYVPEARSIVQAKLDQAADWLVQCTAENNAGGSRRVCFEELEERFGLTIQINSGLDRMLRETLESRPEVAETELDMTFNYVTVVCHPGFCSNTCFSFSAQEENPSGGPGPQLQM